MKSFFGEYGTDAHHHHHQKFQYVFRKESCTFHSPKTELCIPSIRIRMAMIPPTATSLPPSPPRPPAASHIHDPAMYLTGDLPAGTLRPHAGALAAVPACLTMLGISSCTRWGIGTCGWMGGWRDAAGVRGHLWMDGWMGGATTGVRGPFSAAPLPLSCPPPGCPSLPSSSRYLYQYQLQPVPVCTSSSRYLYL